MTAIFFQLPLAPFYTKYYHGRHFTMAAILLQITTMTATPQNKYHDRHFTYNYLG